MLSSKAQRAIKKGSCTMKKRAFALFLAFILMTVTLSFPAYAADNPSAWAAENVNTAIKANLVPQALQAKYTQATTRAEYCALAVALYEAYTGKAITERKTFADTTDVNVEKAAGIGVMAGVGDNRSDPNANLTREQAAVMLARLAEVIGKPLAASAATFADNAQISDWAIAQVGQVQKAGIMAGIGNNTFAPKNPYTREQSIITILRLWEPMSKPQETPPPTADWPNITGPNVWWDSSIYQRILDYAATMDGLVTHAEKTSDEVVIYVGTKWPLLTYYRLTFTDAGYGKTKFTYNVPNGIFIHGDELVTPASWTAAEEDTIFRVVRQIKSDYDTEKDDPFYNQVSPDAKHPWE
jgi:hypothetical protein